jgi:hypothetical protein
MLPNAEYKQVHLGVILVEVFNGDAVVLLGVVQATALSSRTRLRPNKLIHFNYIAAYHI